MYLNLNKNTYYIRKHLININSLSKSKEDKFCNIFNLNSMKQHIKPISSVIFIEYDKPTKCNKCFFADDKEQCDMHKCNPNERKDGKNGYYRKTNASATAEFVSFYDNTKQVIR